jgi:NADH-quinone oxidoreductase subunit C
MLTESDISAFTEKFRPAITEILNGNKRRITVSVDPIAMRDIAEYLYRTEGYRFIIASALHTRRGFEIYYHFSMDTTGLILNIHVILDSIKPEIESLSNLFNASNWIEREMHELFGINFLNHPDQDKLISEGNWAEGIYPMRNDLN